MAHSLYLTQLNGHTLEFYADVVEIGRRRYANNTETLISATGTSEAKAASLRQRVRSGRIRVSYIISPEAILPARKVAYALSR